MALDRYGRNINYVRVSLTDVCNLRCVYCMPEDMSFRPRQDLMQTEEVCRLVSLLSGIGFGKFRLTGGEPTLRDDLVAIVRHIARTPGVEVTGMTTNGILLKRLAAPLADAGLQRVNISIDTIDPAKFQQMTRWGNVQDVWDGIDAAERAGLEVKLNAVVVRGFNDGTDAVELARLTLDRPWQVRFIEVMPFGSLAEFQKAHIVAEHELRQTISKELGEMALQQGGRLDGEARLYRLANAQGDLGFISSVTNPFCAGCNRARLTPDGKLRLCLLRDKELDLLRLLRGGASDDELRTMIEDSIWYKPWGHGLAKDVHPQHRVMSEIGG